MRQPQGNRKSRQRVKPGAAAQGKTDNRWPQHIDLGQKLLVAPVDLELDVPSRIAKHLRRDGDAQRMQLARYAREQRRFLKLMVEGGRVALDTMLRTSA